MFKIKHLFDDLHLFGEGGDGAGAASGADPGTEGQAAAAPETEPTPRKSRWSHRLPNVEYGVAPSQNAEPQQPEAPAQAQQPEQKESWEEIKKRYEKEIGAEKQAAIRERFKANKAAEADNKRKAVLLARLSDGRYGIAAGQDGTLDLDALERAVDADDELIERKASAAGQSVETYRAIQKTNAERDDYKRQLDALQADMESRANFEMLMRQTEEAKKTFPDLDLMQQLDIPEFARLIKAGVPVKTAYMVVHNDELVPQAMHAAAQDAAQKVSNAVQANARRPAEGGLGKQAPSVTRVFDPRQLTPEQRRDIRERVNRGEKISWG